MLIRRPGDVAPSEITPKSAYLSRRELIGAAGALGLAASLPSHVLAAKLDFAKSALSTDEPTTKLADIRGYCNFYEFGGNKDDPIKHAKQLTTSPWNIKIDGLVAKPQEIGFEDIVKPVALEERIYRMRCVEGWSMVIPWVGFPLSDLIKRVEPLGSAKFISFETLVRPAEMPGQNGFFQLLPWPYVEGLRLDEAMHPLTILAVGIYGETIPKENGAPIRLVVPWKYGFKSLKSIVRISFTEREPKTSWVAQNPGEYGFFSNVNPEVDHPRWSQATERRIGEGTGLFQARRPTLMFNGYGEQVAQLYAGLDLKKFY